MAVRRVRRDPATLDQLILRTAIYIGDAVDGARPSAGNRKWEDSAIVIAINDSMAEMYMEFFENPDLIVQEAPLTYTGGSEEIQLPAADFARPIYALWELDGVKPILLKHVDLLSIEKYRTDFESTNQGVERVWAQRDDYLRVRPIPTASLTLRVSFIGHPYGMDAAFPADQHPLPVVHEELLIMGAANRLQYPNDQLPVGRAMKYNQLWTKWLQTCDRYRGPRYPVDNRRYTSG